MSRPEPEPEPSLERLSRFTPDAGRLRRDALLFAAGRSAARPRRGWMALAGFLAVTQALSLLWLWPQPRPPGRVDARIADALVPESRPPASINLSARRALLGLQRVDRPAGDLGLIDTGPPLRAFPHHSSSWN
jgi:hypothetical protein